MRARLLRRTRTTRPPPIPSPRFRAIEPGSASSAAYRHLRTGVLTIANSSVRGSAPRAIWHAGDRARTCELAGVPRDPPSCELGHSAASGSAGGLRQRCGYAVVDDLG